MLEQQNRREQKRQKTIALCSLNRRFQRFVSLVWFGFGFIIPGDAVRGWNERRDETWADNSMALFVNCIEISAGSENRTETVAGVRWVRWKQLLFAGKCNSCRRQCADDVTMVEYYEVSSIRVNHFHNSPDVQLFYKSRTTITNRQTKKWAMLANNRDFLHLFIYLFILTTCARKGNGEEKRTKKLATKCANTFVRVCFDLLRSLLMIFQRKQKLCARRIRIQCIPMIHDDFKSIPFLCSSFPFVYSRARDVRDCHDLCARARYASCQDRASGSNSHNSCPPRFNRKLFQYFVHHLFCVDFSLLKDYESADTELLIYATSLINKTLSGLSDQDSFYDESDFLEQQGMEGVIQRYMSRPGTDLDLLDQLQLYEAVLK